MLDGARHVGTELVTGGRFSRAHGITSSRRVVLQSHGGGCHHADMAHCRVLTCDTEATRPYAFWPVCETHYEALTAGAEYRTQGSEESATGMATPILLMDQSLRDLNEYIVLEPPTELIHGGDCPEGAQIPLRVRRRGDSESDLVLILPDDTLRRLAQMLKRFLPEGE